MPYPQILFHWFARRQFGNISQNHAQTKPGRAIVLRSQAESSSTCPIFLRQRSWVADIENAWVSSRYRSLGSLEIIGWPAEDQWRASGWRYIRAWIIGTRNNPTFAAR
jgi:hypothetical protein